MKAEIELKSDTNSEVWVLKVNVQSIFSIDVSENTQPTSSEMNHNITAFDSKEKQIVNIRQRHKTVLAGLLGLSA